MLFCSSSRDYAENSMLHAQNAKAPATASVCVCVLHILRKQIITKFHSSSGVSPSLAIKSRNRMTKKRSQHRILYSKYNNMTRAYEKKKRIE